MNPKVKLLVAAAVVEMTLLSLGLAAWKWPAVQGLADAEFGRQFLFPLLRLLFVPTWLTLGVVFAAWKRARSPYVIPEDHLRYARWALVAAAVFCAIAHAVLAYGFFRGEALGSELGRRLVVAGAGAIVAVMGNFVAKISPPSGAKAPDPSVWIRGRLRQGWLWAATGTVMVICALSLPLPTLRFVNIGALVVLLTSLVLQRRSLRA